MSEKTLHIYTRVSTVAQEADGTSLEAQQEIGVKTADALGFGYRVWNEGGQSSHYDDLENRPVISELLTEIAKGSVKHLFVFNADRLSRNESTWGLIRLRLVQNNVTLHLPTGVYNLSSPTDKLLLGILSEVSAYDNFIRAERSRLGKLKRIKQGFWMGGPPPFGYEIQDKKLVVHSEEAKWVKHIFEMYVEKQPTKAIRLHLLKNGVKTRREKSAWSLGSIEALLRNTHYGGYYYYRDAKSSEVIRVECPRILSSLLIKNAETERQSRTRQTRVVESNLQHEYLLREFLFCAHCGSRLSGRHYPAQYRSVYYCPRMERNYVNDGTEKARKCENRRYLKISETDDLVWSSVVDVLSKSHLFKEEVKRQTLKDETPHNEQKDKIKLLKRKIKRLDAEIQETTNSIVNLETDKILKRRNSEELGRILENVEKARLELEAERDEVNQQIFGLETQTKWVDWVSTFAGRIMKLDDFSLGERRSFLQGVLQRIDVSTVGVQTHQLVLHFMLPYVDDKFAWIDKGDKKKGYRLEEGVRTKAIDLPLMEKKRKT